jgi:hypothetical protein
VGPVGHEPWACDDLVGVTEADSQEDALVMSDIALAVIGVLAFACFFNKLDGRIQELRSDAAEEVGKLRARVEALERHLDGETER